MERWRQYSILRWLALLVILSGFLLPTFSQALALNPTVQTSMTDDVCSVTGSHNIVVHNDEWPKGNSSHQTGDGHCPLCALHDSAVPPVQPISTNLNVSDPAHWVPELFLQARALRFAWVLQPAQAPPPFLALI